MPVETRVSLEFGRLVKAVLGEDSLGKASIRTGISKAYLMQMGDGKVPSRAIIERFVDGYSDRNPDVHALLVAAGFESPASPVDRVAIALNSAPEISEGSKQRILEILRDDLEMHRSRKK